LANSLSLAFAFAAAFAFAFAFATAFAFAFAFFAAFAALFFTVLLCIPFASLCIFCSWSDFFAALIFVRNPFACQS
jgi:hypothetical protein